MALKIFDCHCHLQDPRILSMAPQLIESALRSGVVHFAVNGIHEKDWHLVKQLADSHPSTIPNFGLHPWFVADRSPIWFETLKQYLNAVPCAAVGEIGLDKGSHGREIPFNHQVEVFQKQLELAKELRRPATIHCVRAFQDALEIIKCAGPFPHGFILHSYLGSAEMVSQFAEHGAYFSFSGFTMALKQQTAKKMLKAVPLDRILLETDAPEALPKVGLDSLPSTISECSHSTGLLATGGSSSTNSQGSESLYESLNHPANIHAVLHYVASLLEMPAEELAEISYANSVRVFSFEGSKLFTVLHIDDSGSLYSERIRVKTFCRSVEIIFVYSCF
ncbi:hypothetical protein MLD38_019600 [Melastoma candidum]|uniref:Uncharacterized protein n=1 Tax=Melastoma candidum TaxID=119954 RepID=A0ACB9QXH9_9MYRT|nr:hypothetical protein MLD38_019600 [Melastoma candidum]